jgi:hypothetical protein
VVDLWWWVRSGSIGGGLNESEEEYTGNLDGGFKFGRKHRSHALIEVVDGKDVQTIVRGGAGAD